MSMTSQFHTFPVNYNPQVSGCDTFHSVLILRSGVLLVIAQDGGFRVVHVHH